MSGEFFESTKEASQRLASIEHHFDTPLDPSVVEFSHLLADRLNPELVPMGFVMAGSLLTYDLQTGLNGFTGEPIDSSLIHQSPELYKGLIGRLPALAEFAFSAQFAAEICPIIDEVTKQPLNIQGSSVEEILAQPIELEHVRGPDTLPEPGVVEVIAVLEDGTKLYSDQELMMLGNEFDPTTYSDPRGSAYGDASIEMILDPLMALGKANGQYFGLDAKGLWKIANIGFNPDGLPDVRKVDLDGQTIYFPTQQMLEKMGVVRRGVELTEPVNTAGVLSYLMRTTSLGDETPDSAEWLPEVDLPGLDPYEIVRSNGELPEKGILLEAQMVRGGNAVFMIYDYDNIENVELDEQGDNDEYQYLKTTFALVKASSAKQIEFSYEQPNYFAKDVEPYERGDKFSYLSFGFDRLDIVPLANNGRLLILKEARALQNLSTKLLQTPWKNNTLNGQTRSLVRWLPPKDDEKLGEALELIAGNLLGIDPRAAVQIKEKVVAQLTSA